MIRAIVRKARELKDRVAALPRRRLLLAALPLALLLVPLASHADNSIGNWLFGLLGDLFSWLTTLMVSILTLLVKGLIIVASYSNFVAPGPTAVTAGWVVTRDLSNMFFIVFLLVIAFGTILGVESYHYSRLLPRLLIMAVVINFSKTICGIFIDMGQVVMLTFVNGFSQAAGGNFLVAFRLNDWQNLAKDGGNISGSTIALGMALAFIMATVSACVVLVMLVMLTFRIVMLWILIVLSPIAFLTGSFPPVQDKYKEWWSMFKKYIISGPVVAFFLWLALLSVQRAGSDGLAADSKFNVGATTASGQPNPAGSGGGTGVPTSAATTDTILSMIIVICLLLGGLKMAQQSGTVGAGLAGDIQKRLGGVAKKIYGAPIGVAKKAAGGVVAGAKAGAAAVGGFAAEKAGGYAARGGARLAAGVAALPGGGLIAAKSKATSLRREALEARKAGDTARAEKLEKSASRYETYSKIKGAAVGAGALIAAPATGGLSLAAFAQKGAKALEKKGKEMRGAAGKVDAKKMEDAGKSMDLKTALEFTEGKRVADNVHELAAAYKKAAEAGRADADAVAAGRGVIGDIGDKETTEAYEKTAREKYGVYFDEKGAESARKRDEALAKGEIDAKALTESGQKKLMSDVLDMDADPTYFTTGPGAGISGLQREVQEVKNAILATAKGRSVVKAETDVRLADYETRIAGGTMTPADWTSRNEMAQMNVASGGKTASTQNYDINVTAGGFNDTTKQAAFIEALKGRNASKVVLNLAESAIADNSAAPGLSNAVTDAVVNTLSKVNLKKMASDALKSGDKEQTDMIKKLVAYIHTRRAAGRTPAGSNEQRLSDMIDKDPSFSTFTP